MLISSISPDGQVQPAGSQSQTTPAKQPVDPLANKDTFIQLLVAQLKYQDPASPADGVQFVSQLAEFSGLEQSMGMRQDLDAILSALTKTPTATTDSTTGSSRSAGGDSTDTKQT